MVQGANTPASRQSPPLTPTRTDPDDDLVDGEGGNDGRDADRDGGGHARAVVEGCPGDMEHATLGNTHISVVPPVLGVIGTTSQIAPLNNKPSTLRR